MSTELTVQVRSEPSLGSWRAWLRPAGPAGQLTVRWPFGITVWLDRAEPQLTLEVAVDGPADSVAALALLRVLYGADAAELAGAECSGAAGYHPDSASRGRAVQALLAAMGALGELPPLATIDLARYARGLAVETRSDDPALAQLLQRVAIACAARGVATLRMLPSRNELKLDPMDLALLDQAFEVVRDLVGVEVSLGPVAEQPPEPPDQLVYEPLVLLDPALAQVLWRGYLASARRGEPSLGTAGGSWLVDLTGCILPVAVTDLALTEEEPGRYRLDGEVTFIESDDTGSLSQLTLVAPESAPVIWARVIRSGDGAVLYAAQCLLDDGRLTATVQVKPEYRYREQFWVELTTDVEAPVRSPFERRADLAQRQGAAAVLHQREATEPEQWAAVAELWAHCARLWNNIGDGDRQALALMHSARAYLAAGETELAAAKQAAAVAKHLDARWLGPDLAQRASSDPLAIGAMINLAKLGPPVTEWVVTQLEQTISGAVPPLLDGYLIKLLDLTPRTADPAYGRIRRLRARARVAVAYYASGYPDTLPLASALLAPASADWPYLDRLGRERFAAVNLQLLDPDQDVPS